MYNNKLVATIKVGNKVLREQGDKVFIPWNSEYSIYLKNLNSQRALVHVSIDGENVTSNGLILGNHENCNLERFINGNLNKGRKFKFIKRTEDIESFRGVGAEDGLVTIKYSFERLQATYIPPYKWHNQSPYDPWRGPNWYGETLCNSTLATNSVTTRSVKGFADPGITVKGSESRQKFSEGSIGELECLEYVIVLQLVGINDTKPITVNRKKLCPSCGRTYKFRDEYCTKDGTFLELSPR